MPQMSPTWWSTLFLMFTMSYMLYMMIMYFQTKYTMKNNNKKLTNKTKFMNWMW